MEGVEDKKTIFYPLDGEGKVSVNLHVSVLFFTRETARKFYDSLFNYQKCKKTVKAPEAFHPMPSPPSPIMGAHYKSSDYDSVTADDAASFVSSLQTNADLKEYQMVEVNPAWFGGEMAHIKPRCMCNKSENKNESNYLYLSCSLHNSIDGATERKTPYANLYTEGKISATFKDDNLNVTRYKVDLTFQALDHEAYNDPEWIADAPSWRCSGRLPRPEHACARSASRRTGRHR